MGCDGMHFRGLHFELEALLANYQFSLVPARNEIGD